MIAALVARLLFGLVVWGVVSLLVAIVLVVALRPRHAAEVRAADRLRLVHSYTVTGGEEQAP